MVNNFEAVHDDYINNNKYSHTIQSNDSFDFTRNSIKIFLTKTL